MSLHVIVLLYPHGAQERGCTACVSVLLSGWSGCRAVSAAVRPLCAVGLSGSCQAVTLGPDSDGSPRLSGSAVRLSEKVLSALSGCRALSGAVRGLLSVCQTARATRVAPRGHEPSAIRSRSQKLLARTAADSAIAAAAVELSRRLVPHMLPPCGCCRRAWRSAVLQGCADSILPRILLPPRLGTRM